MGANKHQGAEFTRTETFDVVGGVGPDGRAEALGFGLAPAVYDELELSYDTDGQLTEVIYKLNGATKATLTLSYSGGALSSVVRS